MRGRPEEVDGRVPGPGAALLLLLAVAGLFIFGSVPLQLLFGEAGLLVAQIVFLFLPVVVFFYRGGFDARRTLPLRLPTRTQVGGGVLFLIGGLQLALVLAWLQSFVVPFPNEYLDAMSGVLRADSVGRFVWLLVVAAALPALVEETLFRGVVLSAFRQRIPTPLAVLVVGLIFGLFHLTPETAFRFVPTAFLGIVLAWVVVISESLPLAILLHFLNNSTVLVFTALPALPDPTADATGGEGTPVIFLATGGVLLLLGRRVLRRGSRAPDVSEGMFHGSHP